MTEQAPPAMYQHCEAVYRAMDIDAEEHRADGDDAIRIRVYEGFWTRLFNDLGLPVPYYTQIRRALINMGCIRQLRRGGGNSPSQWELIKAPTLEEYETAVPRKPRRTQVSVLQEQVKDLQAQMARLQSRAEAS